VEGLKGRVGEEKKEGGETEAGRGVRRKLRNGINGEQKGKRSRKDVEGKGGGEA